MRKAIALLLACAMAAGCAELKDDVRLVRDMLRTLRGKEPAPPAPAPPPVAEMPSATISGMSFDGNCVGRDETGYAENVRVSVAGGWVSALEGRIDIPKLGSCGYRLADFAQTKQSPYVELMARDASGCAIRMWQQGDRVTLAATDCERKCTRGAFDYAWPVEFRAPGGGCY